MNTIEERAPTERRRWRRYSEQFKAEVAGLHFVVFTVLMLVHFADVGKSVKHALVDFVGKQPVKAPCVA